MKRDMPIIGQPCRKLFRDFVWLLADRDFRLLQLEVNSWRIRQAKEGRAKRIVRKLQNFRRWFLNRAVLWFP
jgi:hypothetical protein